MQPFLLKYFKIRDRSDQFVNPGHLAWQIREVTEDLKYNIATLSGAKLLLTKSDNC